MNCRMHSSSVPSAIKYGRAPRVALTGSWLSDGHFRRTAGASKLILTSVSDIPNNPGEILSRQQSFIMFRSNPQALRLIDRVSWIVPEQDRQQHSARRPGQHHPKDYSLNGSHGAPPQQFACDGYCDRRTENRKVEFFIRSSKKPPRVDFCKAGFVILEPDASILLG